MPRRDDDSADASRHDRHATADEFDRLEDDVGEIKEQIEALLARAGDADRRDAVLRALLFGDGTPHDVGRIGRLEGTMRVAAEQFATEVERRETWEKKVEGNQEKQDRFLWKLGVLVTATVAGATIVVQVAPYLWKLVSQQH